MKVTPTRRDGERLVLEMVALVQHTYSDRMAVRDERGLARIEEAWHRTRQTVNPTRGRARLLVGALATLALVIGGTAVYRRAAEKLTYKVMNGTIGPGGFVNPTDLETTILFSEGSQITLGESARTRVDALTAEGGRVVVESGTVHARIVPRKHTHWTVEAGPYTIRVTGTAFKVHWSWSDELLEVEMQRGSVVVAGPLAPSGVTLTAGMRLTANPGSGLAIADDVAITRADSPRTSQSVGAEPGAGAEPANAETGRAEGARGDALAQRAPTDEAGDSAALAAPDSILGLGERPHLAGHQKAGPGQVAHRGADRRVAAAPSVPDVMARDSASWDKRLARGDVQGILVDADALGMERILGRASERDLSALADAARYGRRPALARRTLLTMRDRFPHSTEAREAAFFLGGLAEDTAGTDDQMSALDWYRRYLSESPRGRYAAQAIGRRMVMTEILIGREAARSIADEYLTRFPYGPYAPAAHKLAQTP